ncbi:MAG: hypothetical protein WC479_07130, partial [Candidatus Izemoplasmatales bacterium]
CLVDDKELLFNEEDHIYTKDGKILRSVSGVIKLLKSFADFDKIAYFSERKRCEEQGITVTEEELQELGKLKAFEWKDKAEDRSKLGTMVHNAIEYFENNGYVENENQTTFIPFLNKLHKFFEDYYCSYNEFRVSLEGVAGTMDKACQRTSSQKSIVDVYDYKTNVTDEGKQNIKFDSIKRMKDSIKHYNRYLLPPVEFMEDCSYNYYSIQLNLYAYMLEQFHNVKIGRLGIISIKFDWINRIPVDFDVLPVYYNRPMAEAIFKHVRNIIPLPTMAVKEAVEAGDDDW